MRILLIQSLTEFGEPPLFPLGLCYLITHLHQNEVRICDMNTAEDPYSELHREITYRRPEVIGLSLRNIKVAAPGFHYSAFTPHERTINIIRGSAPDSVLMVGGAAFSLYAEVIMKRFPEIDLGFFGEGEESFPEVLRNLQNPKRVKGIYCRENGRILFTGRREFIPSEGLSSPNRDVLEMGKYVDIPFTVGVQTKRGCKLQCIHCSDRFLLGETLRVRNPVEVVDEIEHLVMVKGVKTFSFVDQIFNIPMDHAQKICEELISRKLRVKWTAWFNEKYIIEDFLTAAKEAGCAYLSFSPDSASDKVLRNLRKNFTTRELTRTYKVAKRVDIKVEYSLMVNAPGETIFTLFKTLIFIIKAKVVLGRNFMLHNLLMTTPIRIYPHTEIKEIAIKQGIIDKDTDLVKPVFYNPAPMKYIVNIVNLFSRFGWGLKKKLKRTMAS